MLDQVAAGAGGRGRAMRGTAAMSIQVVRMNGHVNVWPPKG